MGPPPGWWAEYSSAQFSHQKYHYYTCFHLLYYKTKIVLKSTLIWGIFKGLTIMIFVLVNSKENKIWLISILRWWYILTIEFFSSCSDDGWCLSCHNIGFIPSLRYCGKTLTVLCKSLSFSFKNNNHNHDIPLSFHQLYSRCVLWLWWWGSLSGLFPVSINGVLKMTWRVNWRKKTVL